MTEHIHAEGRLNRIHSNQNNLEKLNEELGDLYNPFLAKIRDSQKSRRRNQNNSTVVQGVRNESQAQARANEAPSTRPSHGMDASILAFGNIQPPQMGIPNAYDMAFLPLSLKKDTSNLTILSVKLSRFTRFYILQDLCVCAGLSDNLTFNGSWRQLLHVIIGCIWQFGIFCVSRMWYVSHLLDEQLVANVSCNALRNLRVHRLLLPVFCLCIFKIKTRFVVCLRLRQCWSNILAHVAAFFGRN